MRVSNKSIIVTGAGNGIGEGIAKRLAAEGGKVIVKFHNFGFSQKRVVDFVREAGQWKIADISDEVESLRRTMQECK